MMQVGFESRALSCRRGFMFRRSGFSRELSDLASKVRG